MAADPARTDPMTIDARLLPWLRLVRLPATLGAWSNVLAAHLIATGGWPSPGILILHLGAIAALLWGGMVLNDCFDLADDRRHRPDRPLPAGLIAPRTAWVLGGGLLVLGLALAALSGAASLRVAAALAVAILAYDALLKGQMLGPLVLGVCRYLSWLLGFSVLPLADGLQWLPLPVLLYAAAAAVLARAATQGVDRGTATRALALLAGAAVALILLVLAGLLPQPLALVLLLAALYPLVLALRRLKRDAGPGTAQWLIRILRLGAIPLDALLVLGSGLWLGALAVLALTVPQRLAERRVGLA